MILRAWRVVQARFARAAFTGEGARIAGGRWNSPGTPVVYLAGTQSLALLEMLVHLHTPDLLKRYVLFEVRFDDSLLATVDSRKLPKSWKRSPAPAAAQHLGDAWAAAASSPVLRVPSAIVPSEWNYLLNPAHPDFSKIRIGLRQPLKFDARLLEN